MNTNSKNNLSGRNNLPAGSGRYHTRRNEFQKKRRVVRKLSFTCMTAVFVLLLALSIFSLSAKADSTENANEYKYYTSHQIEQGETLWSIAENFMDSEHYETVQDYINEIKSVNQMSGDHIQSGNYLLLPYFSEEMK